MVTQPWKAGNRSAVLKGETEIRVTVRFRIKGIKQIRFACRVKKVQKVGKLIVESESKERQKVGEKVQTQSEEVRVRLGLGTLT